MYMHLLKAAVCHGHHCCLQLQLQCREITAIQKEKTARLIPNAISLCTKDERFFFTSFGARDKAYVTLFQIWQNALCNMVGTAHPPVFFTSDVVQTSVVSADVTRLY